VTDYWYPGAEKMILLPETNEQQAIRPTQLIFHSIIAAWTARRTYEYWRDSTTLESHWGLGYAGDLAQYLPVNVRADANYRANRRPDGTGAMSMETASNSTGTDPWTDAQIEKMIAVGAWAHTEHGVPLRICTTPSGPGFGYHKLHESEWAVSGTSCPGPARIRQFREIVFPGIVARVNGTQEEEDMTPEQAKQLADVVAAVKRIEATQTIDPWTYKGKGENHDAYWFLRDTHALTGLVRESTKTPAAPNLTAAQVKTIVAGLESSATLADKIAELVAVKLSKRLEA
jgi:hypothetical protein